MDLTNQLLVSLPQNMTHLKSVIYICKHTLEGAIGMVINYPSKHTVGDLFKHYQLPENKNPFKEQIILNGGPINHQAAYVLHKPHGDWQDTIHITPTIGLSTSLDIIRAMHENTGPTHAIITYGYTSWSAGELETEIEHNDWLCVPNSDLILFRTPYNHRWSRAAQLIGIDNIFTVHQEPGHA